MEANHEKTVPIDWIAPEGNDVTEKMMAYLRPLIIGEVNLKYGEPDTESWVNIDYIKAGKII